jgi:hypothetical protein
MRFAASGFLFLTLFIVWKKVPAEVVTRSCAVVGNKVVTSREVKISFMLDRVAGLVHLKPSKIPKIGWTVEDRSESFKKQLNQRLLDVTVSEEADNFAVVQILEAKVAEKAKKYLEILKTIPAWQQLEVQNEELYSLIRTKLKAEAFLRFKAESATQIISEEDSQKYFEKNRVKFSGVTYEQVRESIKEYLRQQQIQEKLKDWFEVLKRKYKVKNLDANT